MRLLALVLLLCVNTARADDLQLWNMVHVPEYRSDQVTLTGFFHTRFGYQDPLLDLVQISQRLAIRLSPTWSLGTNYSFFTLAAQQRSREDEGDIRFQHRFEVELNPRFSLAPGWRYAARNRLELLYDDQGEHISNRVRHRSLVERDASWLGTNATYSSVELFVNPDTGEFNQARTVPIALRFATTGAQYAWFPMIQSVRRDDEWNHALVVGFEIWLQ